LRETKKWVWWRRGSQASSELIPVFLKLFFSDLETPV
jgi:hypothetical protein